MIDSIGSSSNLPSTVRAQTSLQTSRLRDADVLTAIQQRASNAAAPMRVFAVTQASRNGSSSMSKLPRGSLVDVLA
jgi:hypothetical protein